MGMCVAKYDLFNRWFKIWNAGMKHVFKFLLELLAVFILYKAYRTLPLTVYSEIHWGVYPIVFMAFCCEFINVIPGVRQILLFLGKHSMNIFLIHTFIRKSSFVYVSGYFLTNTLTLLLASLAVSIALEWLKTCHRLWQVLLKYESKKNSLYILVDISSGFWMYYWCQKYRDKGRGC